MFEESRFDGSPMTAEWAATRQRFERLFEVTQIKGQSESHPLLSPKDEFADWDLWDRGNLILMPKPEGAVRSEYWREALKSGQCLQADLGSNPFKYGANLDRVQVIKVGIDGDGQPFERIFDVAWSDDRKRGEDGRLPPVGDTVNRETATYENSIGDTSFLATWTDPEFDAGAQAVYYVRLLEIPTPRWTLYDKVRLGANPDPTVPLVHQERAFSSPIWYRSGD